MLRTECKAAWTVDEAGLVEGLASIFGTADRGGDVVQRGAFKGAKVPMPMLFNHDQGDVIGVWDSITETAQGLAVKGRLLVADVAKAAEARAMILAGALTGLSIGYIATKALPRKGGGRDLVAVDLMEISVVAVPMHPGAQITQAKAVEAGKVTMDPELLKAMQDVVAAQVATAIAANAETKAAEAKTLETKAADAVVAPLLARLDQIEAKTNRFAAPAVLGKGELSPELKAWANYLKYGVGSPEAERKAFNVSSDPQGGYLAPPEVSGEIIRDLIEYSPIRSIAAVDSTAALSRIYITRGLMSGALWHGETVTEPETTGNPFGQREIPLKRISTFVDISNQNLQFAPQAISEVRMALGEDFAKKESVSFVSGTGVLDPMGIMSNAEINYSPSLSASLITVDGLIKFLYSMPASYRNKGTFVMNGTTFAACRTLADTTGQKFWQPSLQAGQPETLLGRPVVECLDMPDVAANAFPILYGDFSGYRILDGLGLSVLVDPFSQALLQRTRYHATRMVGADVLQPFKFRKLKISLT